MQFFKKVRFLFTMAAAKAIAFALKAAGKRGTHMPGRIALRLCSDLFSHLQKPKTLICVTGSNGKTTTANLVASLLRDAGYTVSCNTFGSNTASGIAALLIANSTLTGKHKNEYAVIEVDERSSRRFYPFMKPDVLVCTNLMPDSILRNASPEFIAYIINGAVPEDTKLLLNADDIISSHLAPQCKDRTYFGVTAEPPAPYTEPFVKNYVYCPECGARLQAEYLRYENIGRVHCTACSFATPEPDYCVTDIRREEGVFTVAYAGETHYFRMVNDNVVNIYNACAAVSVLHMIGFSFEKIQSMMLGAEIVKDRFEIVTAGNQRISTILAKGLNSVAVGSVFRYVASLPGDNKCLLLLVDDREYHNKNSENTCWLYDLDYSPLGSPGIKQVIFTGKRCMDNKLRVTMSGLDQSKFLYTETVADSSNLIDTSKFQDIYLLYSAYYLTEGMREKDLLVKRGLEGK